MGIGKTHFCHNIGGSTGLCPHKPPRNLLSITLLYIQHTGG